jgi:hypothetical protein
MNLFQRQTPCTDKLNLLYIARVRSAIFNCLDRPLMPGAVRGRADRLFSYESTQTLMDAVWKGQQCQGMSIVKGEVMTHLQAY